MPRAPAPRLFGRRDRAGANRFSVSEPLQLVHQRLSRRVAARWIFLEAFQANGLEIAWHGRVESARSDRLSVNYESQGFLDRAGQEWRPADQQRVQQRAKRID